MPRLVAIGNPQEFDLAAGNLAKTASVIDFITPPAPSSSTLLAGTYPSIQTTLIQHPGVRSDDNNGATLIAAGWCVHIFFHRICNLARPVETPLCKIWFYSYTSRSRTAAKQLYIQNEGLREIFWEDGTNEDAKRCWQPFNTGTSASAIRDDQ
jgi:hypothetical protein